MGQFGELAKLAVDHFKMGSSSPRKAWESASWRTFPKSASMREKRCPLSTFLGLCEAGYIDGIPSGKYTTSKKNAEYGKRAVDILRDDGMLANDERTLWKKVGGMTTYNQQMDVVIALWIARLLIFRPELPSA